MAGFDNDAIHSVSRLGRATTCAAVAVRGLWLAIRGSSIDHLDSHSIVWVSKGVVRF
jgi:hypothetical protein